MPARHLHFNSYMGRQKPESIINRDTKCPFCDRFSLTDILDERGSIILVKNKYPVLADTFQTVLIETDDCESELSLYPKEHLYILIRFGVEKWLEMETSGEFSSVLLFKNHGPKSGGSIRHPHMQIVGLKHVDYREQVEREHFKGIVIDHKHHVKFNVSTHPRIGFFEFNVILSKLENIDQMADYIQIAAHYILHHFNKNCDSYNLFFYQVDGNIAVKIIPRFIVSPLFVGFSIPQVSNRLEDVVREIQAIYFQADPRTQD